LTEGLTTPFFKVEEVIDAGCEETVDVALEGGKHDFTAYGLVTHNTNPCQIYCMDSNTLVDNVDVIAHAIGHNDFFKNNKFFEPTNENMINKLANHGVRIRKYMQRWGYETVTAFIDHVLRLDTLIDPNNAWQKKEMQDPVIKDERNYRLPERRVSQNNYMDEWVNPAELVKKEHDRIVKEDATEFLNIFEGPQKDIMGFLKNYAPLRPWQQDIISMLYDEAMYFAPQRATKMINEGWASFVDFHLMSRKGLSALGQKGHDHGIWHYAKHKMQVLGGKYSTNPYKTGFELFLDIEDRWNKGKFGYEWDNCKNRVERENWDKKLGLGMEKVFEVRANYNDFLMIQEFFTEEFCEEHQWFEWQQLPNGDMKIVDRDYRSIKKKLLRKYLNAGLPDLRLEDPNHAGKGWMFIQHYFDGLPLEPSYARESITSLWHLWNNTVVVASKNRDGDEIVYLCDGPDPEKVVVMPRVDYEKKVLN
jgi:stage V sporulation protein R